MVRVTQLESQNNLILSELEQILQSSITQPLLTPDEKGKSPSLSSCSLLNNELGKTLPSKIGLRNGKFETVLLLPRLQLIQSNYPDITTRSFKRLRNLGLLAPVLKGATVDTNIIGLFSKSILNINTFHHNGRYQLSHCVYTRRALTPRLFSQY